MKMHTESETPQEYVYSAPDAVLEFGFNMMKAVGLPANDAKIVAECLVQADLRGVNTHGVVRIPSYTPRVSKGLINPNPNIKINRVTPVAASVDGDNAIGFVSGTRAMAEAIDMARTYGVGVATVKNSTHYGMGASYVIQAIKQGFAAFAFTNASRTMPPWGGRAPLLGTSPMAVGFPGGKLGPFVLDMSAAVAARGKIRQAQRRGEEIPLGYALDKEGRPTTDPAKALQGVVLPIGGPKGSGIAMMMDIFSGVLSGAAYAGYVRDQFTDLEKPQNVGHFFMAMRADLFLPMSEIHERMDVLTTRVHEIPKAEGFAEALMPGEIEAREDVKRRRFGIPYSKSEIDILTAEAARFGIAPLPVFDKPLDLK
jgi:LDH2 family malate/lactate/ureidoglycolate dehydrogenase